MESLKKLLEEIQPTVFQGIDVGLKLFHICTLQLLLWASLKVT